MSRLFVKEEEIAANPIVVGWRVLAHLDQADAARTSVFDLASAFKDYDWYTPKNLYFAIMFLYAIGAVKFNPPYVERNV